MSNIIPSSSPSIYDALGSLSVNDTKLALIRPNNPPPGIAGFLLDIPEEERFELESDSTDNYIEPNTPIQDHVALHPETFTVNGHVAELVQSVQVAQTVATVSNPLPTIPALTPQLTTGAAALQQKTVADAAANQSALTSSQSLYGYYQNRLPQQPNQTKQAMVFGYIYQLFRGRQFFSVETPWGIMNNMLIQTAIAKQGKESKGITELEITFKKFDFAKSVEIKTGLLAGRASYQQAGVSHNGIVGQTTVPDAKKNRMIAELKIAIPAVFTFIGPP